MTGMPWHDYSPVMKAAIDAGDLPGFERLRAAAFGARSIRRIDGMAFEANKQGHAYTAFGCTDMMRRLCDAGMKWDRPEYLGLAEECGRTVLTRWRRGGVLSDHGSWLHARTSATERTRGATLNKALIAIFTMTTSADKFDAAGRPALARVLRDRAYACMEQLGDLSDWPNFQSFIATKTNRRGKVKPVARSWLAYALNWDKRRIYFLKTEPVKNGMYAIKCMEMMAAIHRVLDFDMRPFQESEVGSSGLNIFGYFHKTCRAKRRDGWYVNSKTRGKGNFGALSPERSPMPVIEPWLEAFLTKWS